MIRSDPKKLKGVQEGTVEGRGSILTIYRREVNNMPRGDGTGPRGQGPRTGRGLGSCPSVGRKPRVGVRRGLGMGQGRGLGMGQGRVQGRGVGRRK